MGNTRKQPYIVVIGGINIDIKGQPDAKLIKKDSNPGTARMTPGGVGCNIARNLKALGADVILLGATGDDYFGALLRETLSAEGINSKKLLTVKKAATSAYLFINDNNGDMALAVSDMAICDHITPAYVEKHLNTINKAAVVVADTNLPEETLYFLAKHCEAPLFVDPVSVTKAKKILPILPFIHTLKPNKAEAEGLTGLRMTGFDTYLDVALSLIDSGVSRVFITMGKKGVFFADDGHAFHAKAIPTEVKNTTGAGDAFTAALAYCHMKGYDEEEAADFACRFAADSAAYEETAHGR